MILDPELTEIARLRDEVERLKAILAGSLTPAELRIRCDKAERERDEALAQVAVLLDEERAGRKMHESWSRTKRGQGFHKTGEGHTPRHPAPCSFCHSDLVSWDDLPKQQKDINRHAFAMLVADLPAEARALLDRLQRAEAVAEATKKWAASLLTSTVCIPGYSAPCPGGHHRHLSQQEQEALVVLAGLVQ